MRGWGERVAVGEGEGEVGGDAAFEVDMELGFGKGLNERLWRGGHGGLHEYYGIVVEGDVCAVQMIVLYSCVSLRKALRQDVFTRGFGLQLMLVDIYSVDCQRQPGRRWLLAYLMEAEIHPTSRIRRRLDGLKVGYVASEWSVADGHQANGGE